MTSSKRGIVITLKEATEMPSGFSVASWASCCWCRWLLRENRRDVRPAFANELLGSWAPTNAICQANNEAKITISEILYHSPDRICGGVMDRRDTGCARDKLFRPWSVR